MGSEGLAYDSVTDTVEHILRVQGLLHDVQLTLAGRALEHDASKLETPEKEAFDRVGPRLAEARYGSPEYQASLGELGVALSHHYRVNRHHPEHFTDGVAGMNLVDLIEMLADWKAATLQRAGGDLGRSIGENAERFGYGRELERVLWVTARDMGWL